MVIHKTMFGFIRDTFCFEFRVLHNFLLTRPRHKSEMSYIITQIWVAFISIFSFQLQGHEKIYKSQTFFYKNLIIYYLDLDLSMCNVWIMPLFKLHDQFNIHKSTKQNLTVGFLQSM